MPIIKTISTGNGIAGAARVELAKLQRHIPGTDLSAPLAIRAIPNGPVHCAGPLALRDAAGHTSFSDQTFLCRCGGSQNKPYCDGTHRRIGFQST